MELKCDWNKLSWQELKKRLLNDTKNEANKELARRIINNYEAVVNYFIGVMSKKLVQKINNVMGRDTYAEYYEFISEPFNVECQAAEWHRISLYRGECKLMTWTSQISCRHFYKIAAKEKKERNNKEELLEYKDYESLLSCDQPENQEDNKNIRWMKKAFQQLPERDQLLLQYLIIEKLPSIEVYEKIEHLIHPIPKNGMTSDEVKASWTPKRKQDAISLMKGYALDKLLKITIIINRK